MASHFKLAQDFNFTVDVTEFYMDPLKGEYDPRHDWKRRGSILPCGSGVIYQDFGVDMQDRKILIRDTDAMKSSHVAAIDAKWMANQEWYFTDGVHVFRVKIWDWHPWQNTGWLIKGLHAVGPGEEIPSDCDWWSYELILLVREAMS
jgi:hypothetical protein